MSVDGILNINKPRGHTSHDVVALVRRLCQQKRAGHAGTLDPMAEGVLLVALGKATRLVEYLMAGKKVYCAEIVLGVTTTTYDAEGEIVSRAPKVEVTLPELEQAIAGLSGRILQLPPMYSAVKWRGRRLYELAREGVEVEREPREVTVHSARLIDWQSPIVKIELEVSKGTYIRSLAHDLGQRLGTGAYLNHLVRVASGQFTIDEALTIQDLEMAVEYGYWKDLVYKPDEAMLDYSAIILDESLVRKAQNGQPWPTKLASWPQEGFGPTRAYSPDGDMIAVVELNPLERRWEPRKVLAPNS